MAAFLRLGNDEAHRKSEEVARGRKLFSPPRFQSGECYIHHK